MFARGHDARCPRQLPVDTRRATCYRGTSRRDVLSHGIVAERLKNASHNSHVRVVTVGVGHLRGMNAAAKHAALLGTLRPPRASTRHNDALTLERPLGASSPLLDVLTGGI